MVAPQLSCDVARLGQALVDCGILVFKKAANAVLFARGKKFFPCVFVGGERLFPGRDKVIFAYDLKLPILLRAGGSVNIDEDRDAVIFEFA